MAQVLKTTFKLRRGYQEAWEKNNPILESGEPSFVIDKNLLKIGDGTTPWKDLPYINDVAEIDDSGVINADTKENFPPTGDSSLIYKAQQEKKLYQWNPETFQYEQLNDVEISNIDNRNKELFQEKRYEVENIPNGAIVDYKESEIRILCPETTRWEFQDIGDVPNNNMYYINFKVYAPDNAVYFKKGIHGIIIDEKFDFNAPLSGIDELGRKYNICQLALAEYNTNTSAWNYFGQNSTTSNYIGWDYVVEWLNEYEQVIRFDHIRINLANKHCFYTGVPYYMGAININSLVQDAGDVLVLYGGSASDLVEV